MIFQLFSPGPITLLSHTCYCSVAVNMWGEHNNPGHLHSTREITEWWPEFGILDFNFCTQNHLIYFANSRGPRDTFSQENLYCLLCLSFHACMEMSKRVGSTGHHKPKTDVSISHSAFRSLLRNSPKTVLHVQYIMQVSFKIMIPDLKDSTKWQIEQIEAPKSSRKL